ncbi:MAG TPA: hypothetical protein EYP30_00200 [Archaeoglobaceae archaeon]|nr:hypothetical protein [Archaeoglobaceae archaeon]
MKLKDNQLAAIVLSIILITVILYRIVNQETGYFSYYFRNIELKLYMNIVILCLSFISIYGLFKLLIRGLRKREAE